MRSGRSPRSDGGRAAARPARRRSRWAACALLLLMAAGGARAGGLHQVRVAPQAVEVIAHEVALDYGGFVLLTLNEAQYAGLRQSAAAFHDVGDGFALRLGEKTFDPQTRAPEPVATSRSEEADLRLVQFAGPPREEWLAQLRAQGLEIVQYIPPHAYIVWGLPAQRNALKAGSALRWAGDFAPEYRLLPQFQTLAGDCAARMLIYRGADADRVCGAIAAHGGRVRKLRAISNTFAACTVDIDGRLLGEIAAIPGVYSVKPAPQDGGLRGERSDQICANNVDVTNLAQPGYLGWLTSLGLSGAGVILANVDSGVNQNHPDLVNRMWPCVGASCGGGAQSNHGTHTAGITVADGASGTTDTYGFLRGLGIAPGAHLVEQLYDPFYAEPDGMLALMYDSYASGAVLSGNSWGPASTPRGYDDDTMQVDIGVRDVDPATPGNQPFVYVLSIMNGNGGTSSQGTPDEAKNIFTIGSTKAQNFNGAQSLAINDLSVNSAHGPALDGRKIPHLVAPGCYVDSTVVSGYGVNGYCGTSMASPHVSGAIALFFEYYRNLPDYVADPSPALVKAAFTAVAHDLAGSKDADGGALGHRFDSKQGWGRLNEDAVVSSQWNVLYFDHPTVLDDTGATWEVSVGAADPLAPMRIMLAWTDAPGHGLGGSTPAWNNDLDLIVEAGANSYLGNVFGSDGYSVAGGSPDFRNNTEGVFLLSPGGGTVTLRVLAASINSDAIFDEGDSTDQDFALVCYNCVTGSFASAVAPASVEVCAPEEAQFTIDVTGSFGFAQPVTLSVENLPPGATAEFSINPVLPGGSSVLTIGNTGALPAGTHVIDVRSVDASSTGVAITPVAIEVFDGLPVAPAPAEPPSGADDVAVRPVFAWSPVAQAQRYTLEVAADAEFTELVHSVTTVDTNSVPAERLAPQTTYYWRVFAENACGMGPADGAWSFATRQQAPVLLVDGDDNAPDVQAHYANALAEAGVAFDVFDTAGGSVEPDAAALAQYAMAVWFTGAAAQSSSIAAGPGPGAEAALATFLDHGGCLFVSSQDYHQDRGLTAFMVDYLGVASVADDLEQTLATGSGARFTGFGPEALGFQFANRSDALVEGAGAAITMLGNQGPMGVAREAAEYRASFWTFPFEAIPTGASRALLMRELAEWCGVIDAPDAGDFDRDGDVDLADLVHGPECMTGPGAGPRALSCKALDVDGDLDVDLADFAVLAGVLGAGDAR